MSPKPLVLAAALVLAPWLGATPASPQSGGGGVIEGVVQIPEAAPRRTLSRYGGSGAARAVQSIPPLVFLQGEIGTTPDPREAEFVMAQADTAFAPPLLVVPAGATVAFPNRDPFFHNVFSYSRAGRFDLGRYPLGESKDVVLEEPGIIKVYCEVHESMRAALVVVENRYWTEPDPDGAFRIEGVPAGTYTLVAWHADGGEATREVRVRDGAVTRVELSF